MKRKRISRMLAVLLAFTMVFTMMPAMVWADGEENGNQTTLPDASITVPNDAQLFVGSKPNNKHFVPFTEIVSSETVKNNDDTTTYYYDLNNNSTYNYRVSGDSYVTYAGTFKKTSDYRLNVTEEMLKPEGKTKSTIDRDVKSNSGYNVADIYLNINPQGYLKLEEVGATYQLVNLRSWQAVDTITNNYFIEPDYHYTVIDENGNPNNSVVSINEKGLITAKGHGTAIVLVTYDAISIPTAAGGPFFGAIWPENTGVFVVSVDADESGINTGITINKELNNPNKGKAAESALDAEHDVIYFTGDKGEYTFTPVTSDVTVSVANPSITDTMTFTGYKDIKKNKDESYTVPLVQGRNIVKIEKDGQKEYQVITAKKLKYTINNGESVRRGDPVSIVFDTVYHPVNKLAGLYNYNANILYTSVDAYDDKIIGGAAAQYNFASNENAQKITSTLTKKEQWGAVSYTPNKGELLTIPENFDKDTFVLSGGVLFFGGWGDYAGNHRGITYEEGKNPNLNAGSPLAYMGSLPDIEIPVMATDAELSKIVATTDGVKLEYYAGEVFDTTNLVVTATYEDNVTQIATNYTLTPEVISNDTTEITVTYRGKETTIPITVKEDSIQSIAVTKVPTKTTYVVGEVFNPTGIEITATYESGKTTEITDYVSYTNTVFDKAGLAEVKISYTEKNVTKNAIQSVTVNEPSASLPENSIAVSFTLLGDDNHGEPSDATGTHTLKANNLKTWIAKSHISVHENAKVIDVIEKALGIAGIPFTNPSGNYIDTIKGLAAFDNGNKSGWMYTLNGKHPNLGIAEQSVENGDVIILHYTDDYTAEQGSEPWIPPTSEDNKTDVSTSGSSGSATTTTPTQVAVKDDTATATVKDENAKEIINQAEANKSKEIVIDVKKDDVKEAEKVKVDISVTTAKEVVEKTEAALIVSTPNGSVTLTQDALKEAVAEAKGKTISVEVSLVSKPTEIQQNAAGTNGHIIAVTITSDDKAITTFGGKTLTIKAEIPAKLNGKTVIAIHIADDGKIEKMTGKLVTENGKDFYEFETPHLSTFALADADEVKIDEPEQDKPSQDEADKAAEQKAKIKKVKATVTLSTKGIKKGIKVTVKVPESKKADKTGIIIYRSTSRNAKPYAVYKKVSTKGSTYIIRNTKNVKGKNLTKGKTYYYKARAYKVINGKTYYGPMSAIKSIKAK